MLGAIVGVTKGLIQAAGSVVGVRHGTEEPAYTVEQLTLASRSADTDRGSLQRQL